MVSEWDEFGPRQHGIAGPGTLSSSSPSGRSSTRDAGRSLRWAHPLQTTCGENHRTPFPALANGPGAYCRSYLTVRLPPSYPFSRSRERPGGVLSIIPYGTLATPRWFTKPIAICERLPNQNARKHRVSEGYVRRSEDTDVETAQQNLRTNSMVKGPHPRTSRSQAARLAGHSQVCLNTARSGLRFFAAQQRRASV